MLAVSLNKDRSHRCDEWAKPDDDPPKYPASRRKEADPRFRHLQNGQQFVDARSDALGARVLLPQMLQDRLIIRVHLLLETIHLLLQPGEPTLPRFEAFLGARARRRPLHLGHAYPEKEKPREAAGYVVLTITLRVIFFGAQG